MLTDLSVSQFIGLLFGVLFVWWFGEMTLDAFTEWVANSIKGVFLGAKAKSAEDDV